ncbi:MAG: hypothetical protein IJH43_04495 [Mogibacterium sp.]|nr:hypothetical protein [Mogibacterium sp.]MBQ9971958.1 hypothetical protein [Bacillota bacterium]
MMDTILSYAQNQSSTSYTMELIFQIAAIVGLWKMFEKAGQDGWPAIIPFYNTYKLCEITMGNPWYWLRLFVFIIPIVGWILGFYYLYVMSKATARAYGQSDVWALGYMFLSPVFYCITGFGDAQYYGPMGINDNRTGSAREAKTVNFDVIKNEPEVKKTQNDYPEFVNQNTTPKKAPLKNEGEIEFVKNNDKKEETVDFFFDQPEE